jgi:hypothetical protein
MAKKRSKTLNGTKVNTDECVIPPALPKTELSKPLFRQSEVEAQRIREYIEWQTHGEEAVLHVEKVASERVFARDYDVWDVHTDKERWWVITNPTNLYSQIADAVFETLGAKCEERRAKRAGHVDVFMSSTILSILSKRKSSRSSLPINSVIMSMQMHP